MGINQIAYFDVISGGIITVPVGSILLTLYGALILQFSRLGTKRTLFGLCTQYTAKSIEVVNVILVGTMIPM